MTQLSINLEQPKEFNQVSKNKVVKQMYLTTKELEEFINSLELLDEVHEVHRIGSITNSIKVDLNNLK